jgi:hypothetical protein
MAAKQEFNIEDVLTTRAPTATIVKAVDLRTINPILNCHSASFRCGYRSGNRTRQVVVRDTDAMSKNCIQIWLLRLVISLLRRFDSFRRRDSLQSNVNRKFRICCADSFDRYFAVTLWCPNRRLCSILWVIESIKGDTGSFACKIYEWFSFEFRSAYPNCATYSLTFFGADGTALSIFFTGPNGEANINSTLSAATIESAVQIYRSSICNCSIRTRLGAILLFAIKPEAASRRNMPGHNLAASC